ncbi:hypothetical protein [Bacillus sp. FJAT-27986]|uniref:hypothetical protein n=1 Tax=Bacillus sp. FJAT-27986 TaxID=1743146 RepID=UPI00080AEE89|nr:hypothetical protein [Bacillus sp. FJAT-27986]OCA86159.1 hypothetical protein A8L44_07015 [Bacillus sp. FJAT-27986]
MTDYRNDLKFQAKVSTTRFLIDFLADQGVDDAIAIKRRGQGAHNLQAHAASIVPLAVLFSLHNSSLVTNIKLNSDLYHNMGTGSSEARDPAIWNPIKAGMSNFRDIHGDDIVAEELSAPYLPQSVNDVLRTYLSDNYLGDHTNGGAGDTVLKRTLKILSHIFY